MSDLKERVSYLQGLVEGLEISETTKEGKAIKVICDVLREMAQVVEEVMEAQDDLQDYVDSLDDDLADVEKEVYGEEFVEVRCPNCGKSIEVGTSLLEDSDVDIVCPECGEEFCCDDLDWDDDIDDDDDDSDDDEGCCDDDGKQKGCCEKHR